MLELVPHLKTAREVILARILHPNFVFSTFSFAKKDRMRYGYDFGEKGKNNRELLPDSLKKVIAIFEDVPRSAVAKEAKKPISKDETALLQMEEIIGTYNGDHGSASGLLKLIHYPGHINSRILQQLLLKLILIDTSEIYFQQDQKEALQKAITELLIAFAKYLSTLNVGDCDNEVDFFLTWVTEYEINLEPLISRNSIRTWAKFEFTFAYKIIKSQWKLLSAEEIIDILKYHAARAEVEFSDRTISGLAAVNECVNLVILKYSEVVAKIKSSPKALEQIQELPYDCKLWEFVDLKSFCLKVKQKPNPDGIVKVLEQMAKEVKSYQDLPVTTRDLCKWAKIDIDLAKIILPKYSQYFLAEEIVGVILSFSAQSFLRFESKMISGMDAVDHIVWDFLNNESRLCLTRSPVAMRELKPYSQLYKKLCELDIQSFALRLKSEFSADFDDESVEDYKDELRSLLIWAEESESPINLVNLVKTECLKVWAKLDSHFGSKIIESQWRYFSAVDAVDILLIHRDLPNFVNDLAEILILENKEFCNKLIACEVAMQQLKPFKHVHAALSKHSKPKIVEPDLPTVHSSVLTPANGQRRNSLSKSGIRDFLSFTQIGDSSIFPDENTVPTNAM